MITRDNYEIYFIDFIEGNLCDEDILMLESFLSENPDLRAELEDVTSIHLSEAEIKFPDKSSLKVVPDLPTINLSNFEDYLTKDIEIGLTENERVQLKQFGQKHSEVGPYITANKNVVLVPGVEQFENKETLFRLSGDLSFQEACIGFAEGTLSDSDTLELKQLLISSPFAEQIFAEYQKTVLVPEEIVYTSKALLYKKSGGTVIPLWAKWTAAAAVITLGFFAFNPQSTPESRYSIRKSVSFQATPDTEDDFTFLEYHANLNIAVDKEEDSTVRPNHFNKNDIQVTHENLLSHHDPKQTDRKELNYAVADSLAALPIEVPVQIARVDVKQHKYESIEPMSIKAFALKKANELVYDNPSEYTEDPSEVAVSSLGKVLNTDTDYAKMEHEDRKVTSISLGKFGYYRSKKNK